MNRTINVDTGCVFGGSLTALRYPEKELVSVKAERTYYEPVRPFLSGEAKAPVLSLPGGCYSRPPRPPNPRQDVRSIPPLGLSMQHELDDVLDLEDVTGKRLVTTRLHRSVTIREENAAAALEVMSRFGANPKWLVYLARRPARSPGRGVRVLPPRGSPARGVSGEAHGLAGRRRHLS